MSLQKVSGWMVVVMCMVGGILLVSCGTLNRDVSSASVEPVTIEGAEYIGTDKCAVCHPDKAKNFKGEVHSSFAVSSGDKPMGEGCESCHGPGSLHAQAPQDESKILLGRADRCFNCHLDKRAKFNMLYHHPVQEGLMTCSDCHTPHEAQKPVREVRHINDTCVECHPDVKGPWTFPHQAVKEDGCTVCHDPHGSNLDKLLVANSPNLCLRCHFSAEHPTVIGEEDHMTNFNALRRGCLNCHRGVHGSNFNPHLRHP